MKKVLFILTTSLGLLSCNSSNESTTIQDTQSNLDSSYVDTTFLDTNFVDTLKK